MNERISIAELRVWAEGQDGHQPLLDLNDPAVISRSELLALVEAVEAAHHAAKCGVCQEWLWGLNGEPRAGHKPACPFARFEFGVRS